MARGKETCKILKEIRRQIAEANDIEFVTSECRYKGDCLGTCPKCEAEVHYLEEQLQALRLAGKAVALAGISAGIIMLSGCCGASPNQPVQTTGDTTEVTDKSDMIMEKPDITITDSIEQKDTQRKASNKPLRKKDEVTATNKEEEDTVESQEIRLPGVIVQKLPEFPGGEEKMREWISSHVKIPDTIKDAANIKGRITVLLTVRADGNICDVTLKDSLHPDLDKEVLRVMKSMPNFTPTPDFDKNEEFKWQIPITFVGK